MLALFLIVVIVISLGLWQKKQQEKLVKENVASMRQSYCGLLENLSTTEKCITSIPVKRSNTFDFDQIKECYSNFVLKGWIGKKSKDKELIQRQSFSNSNGCEVNIEIYCGEVMYERIHNIFSCEYSLTDVVTVNNFLIQKGLYSMQILSFREDQR